MTALRIIALCILAAMLYGIAHDQVTARVCIEYFTIGHPTIVETRSPTVLALVWGVVAAWWVGLLLGVPLALVSTLGPWPERSARSLVKPITILLACMATVSLLAGLLGYMLASRGDVSLVGSLARRVPDDRHAAFLADLWAHSGAYLTGFAGGVVLVVVVWRSRRRRVGNHPDTEGRAARQSVASSPGNLS